MRGRMPKSGPTGGMPTGRAMSPAKFNVEVPVYLNRHKVGKAFGEIIEDRGARA